MTRWVLFTAVLLLLLICGLLQFVCSTGAQDQNSARPQPTTSPSPPNDSANAVKPLLQCQGCHAAGKTLPYLGGALFHGGPHADYDRGFHALSLRNGAKGATCLDCHSRNGELTTILPA